MTDPPSGAARFDPRRVEAGGTADRLRMEVAQRVVRKRMFGRSEPVNLGRFLVLEVIGTGATGEVYRARDAELGRDVALKIVRPGAGGSPQDDSRVMREARSLARLSHPNVVAIHHVDRIDGLVVIAMEYVAGGSVDAWLADRRRHWREVVGVFVQVARGLIAVHRAKLVHRDVKPSNLVLGDDGVARLSDFGLARPTAAESDGEPDGARVDQDRDQRSIGWGTPAYMAPELHAGEVATALSDQYSFCVALWEGIYGERPPAVRDGMRGPSPAPDSSSGKVPTWLRRVLERGLRANSSERYPSMDALLADLRRDRARAWRLVGLPTGLVAAATVAYLVGRDTPQPAVTCERAGKEIAESWNPAIERAIGRQLARSGREHASETRARVRRRLSSYADAWRSMRRRACLATWVHGSQSQTMLDARMLCLDRRRDGLDAVVDQLSGSASAETADRAATLVDGLASLESCAGSQVLAPGRALPAEPAARNELRAAERQLERARVRRQQGDFAGSLSLAEEVREVAERHDHTPLVAAADYIRALAMSRQGDLRQAETILYRAAELAARSRDDEAVARAWIELTYAIGTTVGREAEAEVALAAAQAALARVDSRADLEADLANYRGVLAWTKRDARGAREHWQRTLELRERGAQPISDVARALNNIGAANSALNDFAAARRSDERALALKIEALGLHHPSTARTLGNLGSTTVRQFHLEGARAVSDDELARAAENCWQSLAVQESVLGPDNLALAYPLTCVGAAMVGRRQYRDAIGPLERALKIREAHPEADPLELASTRFSLAQALWPSRRALGLARAAASAYRRASDPASQHDLARVEKWLARHRKGETDGARRR